MAMRLNSFKFKFTANDANARMLWFISKFPPLLYLFHLHIVHKHAVVV